MGSPRTLKEVFIIEEFFGKPKAADDAAEFRWFKMSDFYGKDDPWKNVAAADRLFKIP